MYLSSFVLPVKLHSEQHLLLSTLTRAVVKVRNETYTAVLNGRWEDIHSADFDCLKKLEFVVDSLHDEKEKFIMDAVNLGQGSQHHFNLHLLPTMGCNFKCSYCFQHGVDHLSFKPLEIDVILNPIEKYLNVHGIKSLSIVLYGGEPTLNWHFTREFIDSLTLILNNSSIQYDTHIITNGYALTDEKLSFLASHNCRKIQVTMDGCKATHDSRRRLANGDSTFDKIVENIHTALDNNYIDKLTVRLNYDKKNMRSQMEFLNYLANEFDVNRILISLGCITGGHEEAWGAAPDYLSASVYTDVDISTNKEHIDAYVSLYSHAKHLGFKMKKNYIINGMCVSKRDHSVLLCPDGNYYKCGGLVGREEHSVGKIGSELIPQSNHYPDLYNKCFDRKCEMIPLCHSGCRLEGFYRGGHFNNQDCKYDLLKGINIELLKFNYGGGLSQTGSV